LRRVELGGIVSIQLDRERESAEEAAIGILAQEECIAHLPSFWPSLELLKVRLDLRDRFWVARLIKALDKLYRLY